MLFHVAAKHSYETCPGVQHGIESEELNTFSRWVEGNEDVKVLGVWGYNVSHTTYAVIEADDMQKITTLLRPVMGAGDVEVLPVMDGVLQRKERGFWGS